MSLRFFRRLRHRYAPPCLYFFPFSIYSIMVRFTIALALRDKFASRELVRLTYQLVNLHRNENLEEGYLVNVNPKGQVPALTAKSLPAPLTDSLSISYWVCERQPSLIPETHRASIHRLLSQLHCIQGNPQNPAVYDLLARRDITPEHRRALEYKRDCQNKQIESLFDDGGQQRTNKARDLFSDVLLEYDKFNRGGVWIFGDDIGPTVLDAHIVAFIARLIDVQLMEFVPSELLKYAKVVMGLPEWEQVMHGRPTEWDPSLGPVDEL
ncbi:hypothetical protein BDV25DRAFT_135404 [Aspergillus avenaceus]|uniref:GST N-terminal domain-containing protein n=1 Tax=Aspergillus avenaceus TaxID=36643 RepID=A0A5N6UA90_ASPAV|nr:hypothetical protein BDV25DRAFT_135404 [Aspergillus avenaceus]